MFLPQPHPHSTVLPAFAELTFQLLSGGLHFSVLTTTDHPHSGFCFLEISAFISCFLLHANFATSPPGVQIPGPSLAM